MLTSNLGNGLAYWYAAAALVSATAMPANAQTPAVASALSQQGEESRPPDYANARARTLPLNRSYSRETLKKDVRAALERDGAGVQNPPAESSPGDGKQLGTAVRLPPPKAQAADGPENFGTAGLPFSTARADLDPAATNTLWPYRAAGKLFFVDGKDSYVCSASLIDRGLVLTAAHCVAEFGAKRMFSEWRFVPGYRNGDAPFGNWSAQKAYVLAAYPDGTAPCDSGVVCRDDIALLVLQPQADDTGQPYYAGQRTGWFSHISGPQPFAASGLTHVTQLGYPVCLDNGALMQRNDAQAVVSADNRNNTVMGSLMCGGASGGPIIANFGIKPALTSTTEGSFGIPNMVIGVTSWGTQDPEVKQQGASPFLSTNIDFLVKAACREYPKACTF